MTKAAKLHEQLATHHQFAAAEHAKAAELLNKDAPGHDFHRAMAEHHNQMAECHLAVCEEAKKIAVGEVAKVSAVAPTIPANIRAVTRTGHIEKAQVEPEFAKFIMRVSEEEN